LCKKNRIENPEGTACICPPGKFSINNSEECAECDTTECEECEDFSNKCTKCDTSANKELDGDSCKCKHAYYPTEDGSCKSCNPLCPN